jgi:hypothetical protein
MIARTMMGAAALLVASVPTSAQETATPQQNLDCAVWAAGILGEAKTAEESKGPSIIFAWFIGLYEAGSGKTIEGPLVARLAQMGPAERSKLNQTCGERSLDFGRRLTQMSERLSELGL